jgi:tripartite-type tricarboxylate transporter receptor subunit TctC
LQEETTIMSADQRPLAGNRTAVHRRALLLGAIAGPAAIGKARAQGAFPERPLRLVVPYPPGGGTDAFARRFAARLGQELGQPVVVENRTGAAGAIGVQEVLRARPDGYSLLFGGASTHAMYPLVFARPQYDPVADLTQVALLGANTVCIIARHGVATDLAGLMTEARRRPGELRFGSPGAGTFVHMAGEYLLHAAGGVEMLHVPYRGNGPAMIDLLAGNLDAVVDTVVSGLPHHQEGRVRMLGVASLKRSPLAPEVPTVVEALGLPGFEAALWSLIAVRQGTPAPLVTALHAATQRALAASDFQAELRSAGIEPAAAMSPDQVAAYVQAEQAKWRPVVEATGVRIE